jgi:hypothetical protein
MDKRFADWLLDVHALLNDGSRQRGVPPGSALETDIERLASRHWLPTERRIRRGPLGASYYSGLTPETDLFAYARLEFLQTEVKDYSCAIGRAVVAELFARAVDLHMGRARHVNPELAWDHYVALVAAGGADQNVRVACLRFGICLVEPCLVPLPVLGKHLPTLKHLLVDSACPEDALRTACLPFSQRFPHEHGAVWMDGGTLHSDRVVQCLLRFQALGSRVMWRRGRRLTNVI